MRPYEQRPDGQWVVALFPQSKIKDYSGIHLFPSMDAAMARYAKSTRTQNIYSSPGEMVARHSGPTLLKYAKNIAAEFGQPDYEWLPKTSRAFKTKEAIEFDNSISEKEREKLAAELWRLCQLVGDQVRGISSYSQDDEDKYKIRIDRLDSLEGREIWEKFPKQCRQIVEGLIKLGKSIAEESELQKMVTQLVADRIMKTKQDPWRIFAYYAPMLGDNGFLYYPGKRHKLDDHEENL